MLIHSRYVVTDGNAFNSKPENWDTLNELQIELERRTEPKDRE